LFLGNKGESWSRAAQIHNSLVNIVSELKEDRGKFFSRAGKGFQRNTCLLGIKVAGVWIKNYWWPNLEISGISHLFGMKNEICPKKGGKVSKEKDLMGNHNNRRKGYLVYIASKSNRLQVR
jgi:hypothetical protein